MELVVVIVVMGAMAIVAAPRFTSLLIRSKIRNAVDNIIAVHAAQQVYFARNGVYVVSADYTAVNAALGLNIVDSNANYSCDATTCTASGIATTFTVTATLANALEKGTGIPNPVCGPVSANCP